MSLDEIIVIIIARVDGVCYKIFSFFHYFKGHTGLGIGARGGGGGALGTYIVRVILIPGFNFQSKGGPPVASVSEEAVIFFAPNYFSGVHLLTKSHFAHLFAHPCTTESSYVRAARRVRWIPNPGSTLRLEPYQLYRFRRPCIMH